MRAQALLDGTMRALVQVETVLPVNAPASAEFDRLRGRKKLKAIGRADMLIAAVVLANNATLVTRNLKDFKDVPGLRLENWAD